MKKPYSQIIQEYLNHRYPDWVWSYEMIAKHTPFGWLGTSADRIARDMAREGLIEREGREEGNFYAKYRAKPIPSGQVIHSQAIVNNSVKV